MYQNFSLFCLDSFVHLPSYFFRDRKDGSFQILAAAFSTPGKLFAATNDHKQMTIWNVFDGWNHLNTRF
jgi:hypothetical protein